MKIELVGKGGCGKSTLSALISKDLVEKGYRVLVVDADESNYGLAAQLGVEPPMELMEYLGEKMWKAFNEKGNGSKKAPILEEPWSIDEIPPEFVSRNGDLALLQIGKVKHFGEGCACPMGGLSKEFLDAIKLEPRDVLIVDTEAGVEHFGRGVEKGIDLIFAVLDPSYESIRLSSKISEMSEEGGKTVYFLLNKMEGKEADIVTGHLPADRIIATIPRDHNIEMMGLDGKPITSDSMDVSPITEFILESINDEVVRSAILTS